MASGLNWLLGGGLHWAWGIFGDWLGISFGDLQEIFFGNLQGIGVVWICGVLGDLHFLLNYANMGEAKEIRYCFVVAATKLARDGELNL